MVFPHWKEVCVDLCVCHVFCLLNIKQHGVFIPFSATTGSVMRACALLPEKYLLMSLCVCVCERVLAPCHA